MRRALFLMVSSGLIASCLRVGPDAERPSVSLAEKWSDESSKAALPYAELSTPLGESFHRKELSELIARALKENLSIAAACAHVAEARAELAIAFGMQFPQTQRLRAATSREKLSERAAPIDNLPSGIKERVQTLVNFRSLTLDVAWEVDLWGKYRRGVEAAAYAYGAADAHIDAVRIMVVAEVATTYLAYQTFRALAAAIEGNVALRRDAFYLAEVRWKEGVTSALDMEEARAALYEVEAMLPEAERGARHARYALAVLLGEPPSSLFLSASQTREVPRFSGRVALGAPADLLRCRPDLIEAEQLVYSASARIGIAKAELYPHLSLVGTIGWLASSSGDLFRSGSATWKRGGVIDWDVLNYGRLQGVIDVERARFQEALCGYRNAVLIAQKEVEEALASIQTMKEELVARQGAFEAASVAVSLAETNYKEGTVAFTTVLMAQDQLLRAEVASIRAAGEEGSAYVHLYRALGSDCSLWRDMSNE